MAKKFTVEEHERRMMEILHPQRTIPRMTTEQLMQISRGLPQQGLPQGQQNFPQQLAPNDRRLKRGNIPLV